MSFWDEDAVDNWVNANPVPEEYARKASIDTTRTGSLNATLGRRSDNGSWSPNSRGKKKWGGKTKRRR